MGTRVTQFRRHPRRPRTKAHDLRDQYAALPVGPDLAPVVMDDPYGPPADAPATRDRAQWTPAPRPRIVVVRTLKHDPLGRMQARRQVSESDYLAGRAYQTLAETAAGANRNASLWDGFSSNTRGIPALPVNDTMMRAVARLRIADDRIRLKYGLQGLQVLQGVLLHGRGLHQLRPGPTQQKIRFLGELFRQCLGEVAVLLGLATGPT